MRGAWCSMRGGRSRWPAGRAVAAGGALSCLCARAGGEALPADATRPAAGGVSTFQRTRRVRYSTWYSNIHSLANLLGARVTCQPGGNPRRLVRDDDHHAPHPPPATTSLPLLSLTESGWLCIFAARHGERGGRRLHQGRGANARAPRARVRAAAATHSRTLDAVRLRVPAPVRVHVAHLPHLHGSGLVGTPMVSPAPGLPQDSGVLSIQLLSTGSSQSRASLPQVSNARRRLR